MENSELNTCPFCGTDNVGLTMYSGGGGEDDQSWFCKCGKCEQLCFGPFGKEEEAIKAWNTRHAERSQLTPLDKYKLTEIIQNHEKEQYLNGESGEPFDVDSIDILVEEIIRTFGTPKIKWPVKCVCICQRDEMPEFGIDCVCGAKEYNEGIDACRRAYEEAVK